MLHNLRKNSFSLFKLLFEENDESNSDLNPSDNPDLIEIPLSIEELEPYIHKDADIIRLVLDGDMAPEEGIDATGDELKLFADEGENGNLTEMAIKKITTKISSSNPKNVVDHITSGFKSIFRLQKSKLGAFRLALTNSKDDIEELLRKALKKVEVLKVYEPGHPLATSGRYTTYKIKYKDNIALIVFCAGANKGHQFEAYIKNSVASRKGETYDMLLAFLTKNFGIKNKDINKIIKTTGGSTNVKRPFATQIGNVGEEISDLSILLKQPINKIGDTVHVSLKNERGTTFANLGYVDGFIEKSNGKVIAVPSQNVEMEKFLRYLGVDKTIVAQGLTDYLNKKTSKHTTTANGRKSALIPEYLASQLGSGYVYMRKTKTRWDIENFYNPATVLKKVGNIVSVAILYPYYDARTNKARKQLSVYITTTTKKFVVEVRNVKGQILPNQMNIQMH